MLNNVMAAAVVLLYPGCPRLSVYVMTESDPGSPFRRNRMSPLIPKPARLFLADIMRFWSELLMLGVWDVSKNERASIQRPASRPPFNDTLCSLCHRGQHHTLSLARILVSHVALLTCTRNTLCSLSTEGSLS